MYFETGLGQIYKPRDKRPKVPPKRPPKAPAISRPRVVPADVLFLSESAWFLKVPFRSDFGAFRQEVAKAIGRHVRNDTSGIQQREENEKRLKAIHDVLKAIPQTELKESDIVAVKARFVYVRSITDPNRYGSGVDILGAYKVSDKGAFVPYVHP